MYERKKTAKMKKTAFLMLYGAFFKGLWVAVAKKQNVHIPLPTH
jgi:hypothetical protein